MRCYNEEEEIELYSGLCLWKAARLGQNTIVSRLLKKNINVNITNTKGETALMLATRHGHHAVVSTLLLHNAETNITSRHDTKDDFVNGWNDRRSYTNTLDPNPTYSVMQSDGNNFAEM